MKKVRIVSNDMDDEFILRSTPGRSKAWGDFTFTTEPIVDCDYCIFLNNNNKETIEICCPPNNIWMFVQEPYQKGHTDWVIERHNYFSKVFTHLPIDQSTKYIRSQTCLPWHIRKTYDKLVNEISPPPKDKLISAIIGSVAFIPGHKKRNEFLQKVKVSNLEMDLFGRGIRPIEDKLEGLENYMFSFAIENNSNPDMWTEKLADCYLSWTMPVYYGCTNLEKYFPPESFIQIDINSPETAIKELQTKLTQEFWESALDSIREARELVLKKYQLFPFLAEKIMRNHSDLSHQKILIPPYKRSPQARINRFFYKAKSSIKKRLVKIKW
jgi:hypothetical protein